MNWFRLYHDIIDDPKIIGLAPGQCWDYVRLLCVSSRQEIRGTLPSMKVIQIHLRMQPAKLKALIATFVEHGLIDQHPDTKALAIHGWEARQRKSDDSGARKSEWRNGTVTGQITVLSRDSPETSHGTVPRPHACASETEIEKEKESLQAGFARPPAREIVPAIKADPDWEPNPMPDESMTGRKGKEHADLIRAIQILDGHASTRRLGAELRMYVDTPALRNIQGWQLIVGAMRCQQPDTGKSWRALTGFARCATETEYDKLTARAGARVSAVDRPPPKSEEQMQAELEESNRKFLEYQAKQRANR